VVEPQRMRIVEGLKREGEIKVSTLLPPEGFLQRQAKLPPSFFSPTPPFYIPSSSPELRAHLC